MSAITAFQIIIPIVIIALVLIQDRSSGIGGFFGGGESFYQKRRGAEKIVFWLTIVFIILFIAISIFQLVQ